MKKPVIVFITALVVVGAAAIALLYWYGLREENVPASDQDLARARLKVEGANAPQPQSAAALPRLDPRTPGAVGGGSRPEGRRTAEGRDPKAETSPEAPKCIQVARCPSQIQSNSGHDEHQRKTE